MVLVAGEHMEVQVAAGLRFPLESGHVALVPSITKSPWANHKKGVMERIEGGDAVGALVGESVASARDSC